MKAYIEYHLRLIQYNIVNEQICYEPSKQSFTMLHCKKKLAGNTTYILLSWRYLCMIHSKKKKRDIHLSQYPLYHPTYRVELPKHQCFDKTSR